MIENILGSGFFPKEMPPVFNSKELGVKSKKIISNLQFNCKESSLTTFSIPRAGKTRRFLAYPNPIHYIKLCIEITSNWKKIEKIFKGNNLSKSLPIIDVTGERGFITQNTIGNLTYSKTILSKHASFLLKTDISKYYSSIYTHSIAWAIHGKEKAKKKRFDRSLLGNKLDVAQRSIQSGQSVGVPAGPDSSLIISEIIGSVIDDKISESKFLSGFRYIDDYYLFFENKSNAIKTLNEIEKIYSEYSLELSPDKTSIIELPISFEPSWVYDLRTFELHLEKNQISRNDLVSYFNKSYSLHKSFGKESILKYSLNKLKVYINSKQIDRPLLSSYLMACMQAESSTLPIILEIVRRSRLYEEKKVFMDFKISLFSLIEKNLMLNHHYEVTWCLFLIRELKIKVPKRISTALNKIENPYVDLLYLDLFNLGLITEPFDQAKAKYIFKYHSLYGNYWLFIYESIMEGWMKRRSSLLKKDKDFSVLLTNNVRFYDSSYEYEPMEEIIWQPTPGSHVYREKFELIGYD